MFPFRQIGTCLLPLLRNFGPRSTPDKRGKYGRYLGEIVMKQGRSNVNANDALVQAGHAEYVEY